MKKNKGMFLTEAIICMGIFSIFMSLTFPLIRESIRIRSVVRKELRYNRNFMYIMDNIKKEVENSEEIEISKDGKILEITKNIFEKDKNKKMRVVYKFTGSIYGSRLLRYVTIDGQKLKDDIVFETVKGKFFEEDGFIKVRISYKTSKEEEYIWK
ncbi:type II secretion system protein [Fusobacterium sp.]|uniref:type II secretion system protein n=1 Tax=Fusobacterium sp. TaxID=68766 RepID=UPI00260FEED1|nr:type II secretion system protein [Fusobacterium sp.]